MSDPIAHPIDANATRVIGLDNPDLQGDAREGGNAVGPSTPWEYQQAARTHAELEEKEAIAAQRTAAEETATRLAAGRLSNGDPSNAPHFCLNVDGRELCGQCGETFPCSAYLATNPASAPVEASREYAPIAGELLSDQELIERAAAAIGVSPQRLAESLSLYRES